MRGGRLTSGELRMLLAATTIATFVTPLMSTMLNLSLLDIGEEFDVGSHDLGYVNTMFILGSVIGMVPAAKIASIYGMRKVFLSGILGSMASALIIMSSPNFPFLIVLRLLTGIFASQILVTSVAMIGLSFPVENRGWAIGVNTTGVYIGLSLGPTIGGLLSDTFGWRSLFVLIVALFMVAFAVCTRYKGEMKPQEGRMMDWKGAVMWGISIFVLMYGVVNMSEGWALVMIAVGGVLTAATIWYLLRAESPVLNVKLFRDPTFAKAALASFMNYGACYSIAFFLALYLQSIGKMTATEAGIFMLLQPLIQVLLTAKAGAVSDRMRDKRVVPVFASATTAVGIAMFIMLGTDTSMFYVAVMMVILGVGLGCFGAPVNTILLNEAPVQFRGDASGVVALVRQTGMMVSMGFGMACISFIMGSTDNLGPDTYDLFIDVIRLAFSICLVMCILALICCLTLKPGREVRES
ncbi:Arabinose efflux permease [Thermoplasmatales archaeon BRNA1]|nr:Arabinose efflux permease [Thermoplasmatales archaeon BRNA1]